MDAKRHPSSFQQLEKLGEGTYATVRSPNAFEIVTGYPLLTYMGVIGLQGTEPPDGRTCRPQGDSP